MVGQPDENGIEGLPEEWGRIHIPDDARDLDPLAEQVRRELFKAHRAEMRLPYLILAIAVVMTLIGMFVVPAIGTPGRVDPSPTCCQQSTDTEQDPTDSVGS